MRKIIIILFLCVINLLASGQARKAVQADTTKAVSFAGMPIINYNASFGLVVGAMGQAYYKVNKNDTVSPSSFTGVFGMYTSNQTYFVSAIQKLYLKQDSWRLMFGIGTGNINFQYWQDLPNSDGEFISFGTKAKFAMVRGERKVLKKLYAGVTAIYSQTETEYDLPEGFPDSLRYDNRNMNNLGYQFHYDNREHQVNPYGGFNVEFKNSFYRTWLNSGNDFNKYQLTYNHYHKIKNERNILATRFKASVSNGDVPFQGQNVIGQEDIRGYSSGKYRDDQLYAAQAEYRWRFYKKFGMVGFLGVATVVKTFDDVFSSKYLPGIGAGVRYLLIEKERVNVGVDVAFGNDDWGLYFRIGESFGR